MPMVFYSVSFFLFLFSVLRSDILEIFYLVSLAYYTTPLESDCSKCKVLKISCRQQSIDWEIYRTKTYLAKLIAIGEFVFSEIGVLQLYRLGQGPLEIGGCTSSTMTRMASGESTTSDYNSRSGTYYIRVSRYIDIIIYILVCLKYSDRDS